MGIRHLVLEVAEDESAQSVQARLNAAGLDGFFLVNVVGRLLLLRASIAQKNTISRVVPKKTDSRIATRELEDATALQFLNHHAAMTNRSLEMACKTETGVVRSYMWFQRRKKNV